MVTRHDLQVQTEPAARTGTRDPYRLPEIVVIVMSAPVVRIPSPRRPVGSTTTAPHGTSRDSVSRAHASRGDIAVPAPRAQQDSADGGAHRLTVPAPRPASPRASTTGQARSDDRPSDRLAAAGRHRAGALGGAPVRGAGMSPSARAFLAVARAGSLTTLAAMVVLAAAVAGLADGAVPTGPAAGITATTLH